MRINGLWLRDPEQPDLVRPVITAKLLLQNQELPIVLLIDTGADRTVLGSAFAEILEDAQQDTVESFVSAGGQLDCFLAAVRLELQDVGNRPIRFSTSCVILADPNQKNEHLLGRDILDYFALICDREANQVALLRPPHRYSIHG
jgi:predicted aspartyl protease